MSQSAMSIPLSAVPRTMSLPCQKCWRNIFCQRCSIRLGSSPTISSARSSTAPTTARVCHSSVASPQPWSPGSSVRTRTKTQLRIRAWQTCVSTAVILVRVRDPVGPAVAILVEQVVQRDVVDQLEVLARRQVAGVVVRIAEGERRRERAAVPDADAALVEELERVRGDRRVADPQHLQLRADGL